MVWVHKWHANIPGTEFACCCIRTRLCPSTICPKTMVCWACLWLRRNECHSLALVRLSSWNWKANTIVVFMLQQQRQQMRSHLLDNTLTTGHGRKLLVIQYDPVLTVAQRHVLFECLGRYELHLADLDAHTLVVTTKKVPFNAIWIVSTHWTERSPRSMLLGLLTCNSQNMWLAWQEHRVRIACRWLCPVRSDNAHQ
jgi:hypothetical protein